MSFWVEFDPFISITVAAGVAVCDTLFETATVTSFGVEPTCNVQGNRITVTMTGSPPICGNETLFLIAGVLQMDEFIYEGNVSNDSIKV
jgi:hypothetical protein